MQIGPYDERMDVIKQIRSARTMSGLNRAQIASLAGVSASTVTRIESGQMQPTVEMVERLVNAAGFEFEVTLKPKSDPVAVAAARTLLEPGFKATFAYDVTGYLEQWARIGLIDKTGAVTSMRDLAFRAAQSARLAARPGIRYYERTKTWIEAGRAFNEANLEWANTGDSAANRLISFADQIWPVFYVEDVDTAAFAAGLVERNGTYGPSISLIPFDGFSESGRWEDDDGMWFADSVQVLIDCYAGTTRMPEQADALADMWDRESLNA